MNELITKTDLCVKCGLCLPHCPTYQKTQNENESPRGRLALIEAWAKNELPGSNKLQSHIDNCLLCRSCESVCPAQVPYGEVIDNFRNTIQSKKKGSLELFLLKKIAHHKKLNHLTESVLATYQSSGFQKIIHQLKLSKLLKLDNIDRLIDNKKHHKLLLNNYYPSSIKTKETVGLFTGCMGTLLDQETVKSAITLLNIAGVNVNIPDNQTCCGALDLHSGDKLSALHLEALNQQAFASKEWLAIISIASGCGSQLQEYQNKEFAHKTIDISQFFLTRKISFNHLSPLNATVLLHTPCSLKNIMGEQLGAVNLIKQIPDITIKYLPSEIQCCGSAGSYMLQQPEMAGLLADDLIDKVMEGSQIPKYLVTSNIGCALHISAQLRERNIELEVIHPVTLIARQLR